MTKVNITFLNEYLSHGFLLVSECSFKLSNNSTLSRTAMALVEGYSSDDDEQIIASSSKDAFGLSALPSAKKAKLDYESSGAGVKVDTSAPDVLLEVRFLRRDNTLALSYATF